MKMLSMQRPRPSIDTFTPASVRVVIYADPVNCYPWSVFMISSGPYRSSASFKANQQSACIVFDSSQLKTFLVVQSMMATRYKDPRSSGMKVMSEHQT